MVTASRQDKKTPRGKARFELESNRNSLTVHLDRQGFRRLLETLERLAETGEAQTFDKSGRGRTKVGIVAGEQGLGLQELIFRIDDK